MSCPTLRRRLAVLESQRHRPPPMAHELADLMSRASPEVLTAAVDQLAAGPVAAHTGSTSTQCSRCGYGGPFSKRTIYRSALATKRSTLNRGPVSARQIVEAFERSSPATMENALILALCELDPTIRLMAIDCPSCGHSKLNASDDTQ
jgi:hypothetical protein